jgi:hypothetical protein
VRVNVTYNDTIPCSDYVLSIAAAPSSGSAKVASGGFIEYRPDQSAVPPDDNSVVEVPIVYRVKCGATERSATLTVRVKGRNNPANVIPADVACYDSMPANTSFGIRKKFNTARGKDANAVSISAYYGIDAFTAPLVGDLNGDGKPEIVIMGTNSTADTYLINQTSINIYNGQTGELKHIAMLANAAPPAPLNEKGKFSTLGLTSYTMGAQYHRAPSILALADVDADGLGEIIYCDVNNSHIYALKPTFEGENLTSVSILWKSDKPYRPSTGWTTFEGGFVYPHPYIADLNGDGVPEVIVYNKIYNAETGRLLMAWGGETDGDTGSSDMDALKDVTDLKPTSEDAAKKIRKVAATGRRPHKGGYYDRDLAVPAIADIDGDGRQEIIAGNRIYKFNLTNVAGDEGNEYRIIKGPQSVELPINEKGDTQTFHLSDGFTRVADIDGDGLLDVIAATGVNTQDNHRNILLYVWSPQTKEMKAAVTFYANTNHGTFSIPFVGDINGKKDGWDGTERSRKLPEICILTGGVHISRATDDFYGGRTGLSFHPSVGDAELTAEKFGGKPSKGEGHIVGLTYDGEATKLEERLKISWAMEHTDNSNNTGITLFDFDNNGAADICYRDMNSLRVVSPAKSKKDYVRLGEKVGESVLFEIALYNNTGFEFPVIADVNMDGSADIVVTGDSANSGRAVGLVYVFEYSRQKFAPCPPVWNQSMYDPRQIREDLQVNARPVSMLAKYYSPAMCD